jgi:quinol monooxygenase YgiN
MPVAVHICPDHMSKQDYERVIAELKSSGADQPEGRRFHAAYGDRDNVCMFEVWDSREHFEAHRDDLFATLQGVGLGAGDLTIHPLHSEPPG